MNEPRFSIVIPAYNNASTLVKAVESVLSQTWAAHEIIVVDDASTDDTKRIVEQFGNKVLYFQQPVNKGVSAARNFGAWHASGNWLAFLDADDWYFPDRLKLHAEWIREDPSLDFLTGDYEYRDEHDVLIGRSMVQHISGMHMLEKAAGAVRVVMDECDFEEFVADHFGDTHTLSIPVDVFRDLGGYPLGFKVCEDVHLLTRLVARSHRAGVICSPLAVYRIHGGSATRRDPIVAQHENVRTLEDLVRVTMSSPISVRRGLRQRLLDARYNLGSALIDTGRRWMAVRAVAPSLLEYPGWKSLRNMLSMLKG